MKSSIIPKEEAGKYKIDNFFENVSEFYSTSPEDKFYELTEHISDEEKEKINKLLEAYFLGRNRFLELSRKFKDFFDEELKKSQKISPSQKFIDFLIAKKISGPHSRKKSNIIAEPDLHNVESFHPRILEDENQAGFPKIIRNEQGDITAIEVKCNCGEIIHIDIEFE